ncbi:MAG: hypothetical protein M5U01_29885 [Ardenticatenaceae bacterium]|nr:hypothetical protein [Ardenticatenaceae bacterium]HBY95323.1 hypothetical protein [Chloroflexota bacterium]
MDKSAHLSLDLTNEANLWHSWGMDTQEPISRRQQVRQELDQLLAARHDARLDLRDALCGSPNARSVVELSLSPLFRREDRRISDAIDTLFQVSLPETADEERQTWDQAVTRLIGRSGPAPPPGKFWLLGTDGVPVPRPLARTLSQTPDGEHEEHWLALVQPATGHLWLARD